MSTIKGDNYFVVLYDTVEKYNLKSNELIIYSIIRGFSQTDNRWFTGSINYLAKWINGSKSTVVTVLKKLVEKKLVEKKEIIQNGVKYCKYRVILEEPSDEPTFDAETLTEPNKGLKTQNNEEAKPLNDNTLAFMAWEEIMGVKINKNIKFNRYSCNRLVKKYGLETVKKYISLAKAGLGERYCPNCYNFIDLEQKLPALLAWGKEKYEKKGKTMMTLEDL